MGEPTLTEETAFSPRRFLLFAFLLPVSCGSALSPSLSLSLSLSSSPVSGELPARERASTSTYSPSSPTLHLSCARERPREVVE